MTDEQFSRLLAAVETIAAELSNHDEPMQQIQAMLDKHRASNDETYAERDRKADARAQHIIETCERSHQVIQGDIITLRDRVIALENKGESWQ